MLRTITAAVIALTLAAAGAAVMAPPAAANYWHFAGEHQAGPNARYVADMALTFWRARGITACPQGLEVLEAPNLTRYVGQAVDDVKPEIGVTVVGRGTGCTLWLHDDALDLTGPVGYCLDAFHETKHALGDLTGGIDGRGHTRTGVMAAMIDERNAPSECKALGRRSDGRDRARVRAAFHRYRRHSSRPNRHDKEGNTRWATAHRRAGSSS